MHMHLWNYTKNWHESNIKPVYLKCQVYFLFLNPIKTVYMIHIYFNFQSMPNNTLHLNEYKQKSY